MSSVQAEAQSPLESLVAPRSPDEVAAAALSNGPVGALVISAIAVAILFIGWILFYFFLFMPRGSIG
jgi:hypothetical protein